jgi:ABC-type amino acid transport substrate-binding protein
MVTENFPPYQMKTVNGIEGLSVDILISLNNHLGIETKIDFYPWARAYKIALNTPTTLIFSITRTKARDNLFHWIGMLPIKDNFARWTLKNDLSIDVIDWNDSSINLLLAKGLGLNKDIFLVNKFEQAIDLLRKERVNFIVAGEFS